MKKKTKEKDLTGEVIKFSELQTNFLNNIATQRQSREQLMEFGGKLVNDANKKLWKAIMDFRPDTKEYYSIYNSESGELRIAGGKLNEL